MSLFQIAEPGESQAKSACKGRSVGIDLGTTNSLIAGNDSPSQDVGDVNGLVNGFGSSYNLIGDGLQMYGLSNGSDGNQVGTSTNPINPAFEALTGYTAAEVIGKTPSLLNAGHHPAEVFEELWATLREGKSFRFILVNKKKDPAKPAEFYLISYPAHTQYPTTLAKKANAAAVPLGASTLRSW